MNLTTAKPAETLHNLGSTKALEALEALEAHYNLGSEEVSL